MKLCKTTQTSSKKKFINNLEVCPGDGIGIHAGLRSRILGVRVSPGAPY